MCIVLKGFSFCWQIVLLLIRYVDVTFHFICHFKWQLLIELVLEIVISSTSFNSRTNLYKRFPIQGLLIFKIYLNTFPIHLAWFWWPSGLNCVSMIAVVQLRLIRIQTCLRPTLQKLFLTHIIFIGWQVIFYHGHRLELEWNSDY